MREESILINNIVITVLYANEGYNITDKATHTLQSTEIWLGVEDSVDNYEAIPQNIE